MVSANTALTHSFLVNKAEQLSSFSALAYTHRRLFDDKLFNYSINTSINLYVGVFALNI